MRHRHRFRSLDQANPDGADRRGGDGILGKAKEKLRREGVSIIIFSFRYAVRGTDSKRVSSSHAEAVRDQVDAKQESEGPDADRGETEQDQHAREQSRRRRWRSASSNRSVASARSSARSE